MGFLISQVNKKQYRIDTSKAIPGEQCICPANDILIEKNKDKSVKISLLGKTKIIS